MLISFEPITNSLAWWNGVGAGFLQRMFDIPAVAFFANTAVKWLDVIWFLVCLGIFLVIEWRRALVGGVSHRLGIMAETARHIWVGVVLVAVVHIIKYTMAVPRPGVDFWQSGILGQGTLDVYASFPSLHAALFLYLSCVAGSLLPRRWFRILCVAMLLWISLSRVIVGYHYPADILAGWILGLIAFLIAHRRSYIE